MDINIQTKPPDIGMDKDIRTENYKVSTDTTTPSAFTLQSSSLPPSLTLPSSSTSNTPTVDTPGTLMTGEKKDLGKVNLRGAVTLLPFEPSSPKRKKVNKRKNYEVAPRAKPLLEVFDGENWARFFIIKKKNGSFSKDCPFKLGTSLKGLLGKVKSVRKQNDGSLCIEANTPAQAKTILGLTKVSDADVEVGPHRRLNTSQGVVTCQDLLNSTVEDIKEGLASEGVVDVRRIKRRQGDTLVDTASLVLTFDKPRPPTSIDAAFYHLQVRPYVPSPMRCFKCQKYGHTAQRCKVEEAVCACGKPTHEGECTPPYKCVNCGGEHSARAPACPVLQEEKEIQKVKTLQQLPYREARDLVRGKSYIKPTLSYSDMAKATPQAQQPSPVLKEFIDKFKIKTPTKGTNSKEVPEPLPLSHAISKGQPSVGIDPPKPSGAPEGPWTVVSPKRTPKAAPKIKRGTSERLTAAEVRRLEKKDFMRNPTEVSLDSDASSTPGSTDSQVDRGKKKKKKGWPKGKPRKPPNEHAGKPT